MIRHLSRKHSVTVASLAETDQELDDGSRLKEYCSELITEVVPKPVRWMQAWQSLFTSVPSSAAYFWSARLQQRIHDAVSADRFDLALVHCAFVARYVVNTSADFKVLDYGDLDSGKWLDYARWKSWPLSWGYRMEATKLHCYERRLTRHFDQFTVTAPGELEAFGELKALSPCTLIPNGVDGTYFHPSLLGVPKEPVITFVGRMDYFPNIDGVLYFVRQIYPLIRKKIPGVKLRIVGSNPVPSIRDLARSADVTVTGHVSDVRPYLADASLAIAPLRIARGTQNKILESMAMGVPVVATSQAAKGVQAVSGRDLLTADEPERFAAEVIKLLGDASLRAALSAAARQQIEAVHSWPASMEILDGLLTNVEAASRYRATA